MSSFNTVELWSYLHLCGGLTAAGVGVSGRDIIAAMADPKPAPRPLSPLKVDKPREDQMLCERCGAEMYRMHAVWRCPACGFKTDCCGW